MKVAVVFASFNRREVTLECVARLRAQTRLPDRVVVADNASTDGSVEALREIGWDRLEIVQTGDNLGNAGAVKVAMEHAFAQGLDAVWILDDDSWPRPDALEAMLRDPWDGKVLRHPLQCDPGTGRFTWPLQRVHEDGSVTLAYDFHEVPENARIRSRGVWTGALISREIRERSGPVLGELFIRGEDEEYPWRIEEAGFPSEAVTDAILDHPGPEDLVHFRLFGRSLFLERGLADWKLYYKVRNMVWLKRRQGGARAALMVALAYAWALVRVDGCHRIRLCLAASCDGWRNRLGRWRHQP
jgi:GT2 family glycosyltransferase